MIYDTTNYFRLIFSSDYLLLTNEICILLYLTRYKKQCTNKKKSI